MTHFETEIFIRVMPNLADCQEKGILSPGKRLLVTGLYETCCPFFPSENEIASALCEVFGCTLTSDTLASFQQFQDVAQVCGLGHFWRKPLFNFALERKVRYVRDQFAFEDDTVRARSSVFISRWLSLKRRYENGHRVHRCVDLTSLFVAVVTRGERDHLVADDLIPWVEDVADTALDLTDSYLREPYVDTVLARILLRYGVHLSGILTVTSLRVNGFTQLLRRLSGCPALCRRTTQSSESDLDLSITDEEQDLPNEFSYDDFLAIFGLYWELTSNQKSLDCIRQKDLYEYAPLSKRFLCEVFKVASVRPFSVSETELSYPDFVWLIVSAEGKGCWPQSTEYLFRVLDLESDGVLTTDELHYFYEEHLRHRSRTFQDVMCEIVDAIRPVDTERITLLDIRRSGLAHVFFAPFVDAPDSHRHHRWGLHRRRTTTAAWWPTGCYPDLGYWDSFVQDHLDNIRYGEDGANGWRKDQTRRYRFSTRQRKSRKRKSRFNSI